MPVYLRRFLFGVFGLLALVLLLVLIVAVALQFPAAQDFVARRAENYLRDKLKTEVRIGKFRTDFRHAVNLDDVYLADDKRDTLLSVGHLGVSIALWDLAKGQINVSDVELNDGRVRLTRTEPDSATNYDFIVRAFTDPTAPKDTAQSTLKYDIGRVRLTNIYFTQNDQVAGLDLRARLGELLVNMDEVDVAHSVYKVDNARLSRAGIYVEQTKTAPELDDHKPTEPLSLVFGLNRATLENVGFTYKNGPSAQYINTQIGLADVTARDIDLARQRIALDKLTLKNTAFAYAQNENVPVAQRAVNPAEAVRKVNEAVEKAQPVAAAGPGWRVTLGASDVSGLAVKFDNFNQPRQRTRLPALDYNHLAFTDLVLNTRNVRYSANSTTGVIEKLAGRELSGFRVDDAHAAVVYDSVQIRLDSLDLVTPHTRIRRSLGIGYASLDALSDTKQLPNLKLSGDLRETRLGFRDILYLAPQLAGTPPFTTGPNQSVLVSGQVAGRLGDFTVRNLDVVGLRNTELRARRGRIVGLPNVDQRLYTDLDIQQFRTSRADVESLVPRGTLPPNFSLPPTLALSGTFRGRPTALQFNTNLKLNTSYGNVAFSGDLGAAQAGGQQPLVGTFAVQNFDAGKLLKNPQLGRVTATGRVNARGNLKDPATLVGQVQAQVQRAEFGGYAYRGIAATVGLDRNRYNVKASSRQDPNLAFDLTGTVNLRDAKVPAYAFNVNLRGANLKALKLYSGDLRVQGNLVADLRGADLNSINGTFSGNKVVIVRDNQPFALDSLQGRIVQTAARTAVDFNSNVLAAKLDGNVRLGNLATELQRHLDRYFRLAGVTPLRGATGEQQFTYSVQLKSPQLATKLVPGLKQISPFTLAGEYRRSAARLTAQTSIPLVRYQNYRLDSVRLDVNSDPAKLDYALRLAQAQQDTTLKFRRPSVIGSVADNKVQTRVAILGDSARRERLALAGTLQVVPVRGGGDAYEFVAAPEQILNYERWTAGTGNFVRYNPDGSVAANNLRLTNGRSALAVQSENPQARNSPLTVRFEQFDLAEIARAVQQQDSLFGGTLNGQATAYNLGTKRQAFTANLTVSNLLLQKAVVGDLSLQATNPAPNRYDLTARLTGGAAPGGQPNDVTVRGTYAAASATPLNFTADVARLNVRTAEPFSAGQVSQGTGYLSGQLAVTGAVATPQVRGQLRTSSDAGFVVPQLGSPFRLPDQTVTFDDKGIAFNNFTVLDSAGNKAVANGYLLTKNFVDYAFDLRATTNGFLAVKSTRKNNSLYYGRLVLDSETRLTGPLTLIKIDTRATVADGSDLTVVSPANDPAVVQREGIVEFVDKSAPLNPLLAKKVAVDTANIGAVGYDITAEVTVTNRTPFTLVIDPASGDNLRVRAAGTITTHISPSGAIRLDGGLTVARGTYRLSLYGLATREFIIRRGSSLTWSGDPYNADLNLTAVYNVKAAPADLLASQGSLDPNSAALGRNLLPFNVLINVTGQLSKPTIGFDITQPPNQRSSLANEIDARLAQLRQPDQSSEQAKQVFSLLILGRFIQQNPFQTTAGEGLVASQLRGSVSQVLTDQLQNLTGKYLAGLGLDLGVTNQAAYGADGSTGSRTDLNVAVRRQLLNNRLTVRLGTDVPLSGNTGTQSTQGNAAASNFAGDVSLEYLVLRDGRLRLRAYRQNAFEDIDGQIVRTGAALVYQREYNNFAELFERVSRDVRQQRRANRKDEKEYQKTQDRRDQQQRDSTDRANGAVTTFQPDSAGGRPRK